MHLKIYSSKGSKKHKPRTTHSHSASTAQFPSILHSNYYKMFKFLLCLVQLWLWHKNCSLICLVCAFNVLRRLPEGSRSKRKCLGWDGSQRIFGAFLTQQELYRSSREGRGQPKVFLAVLTALFAFLSAAVQLENHTETQLVKMLYRATVKGHEHFLCEVVIPEYSQEVQSLLCLLDNNSGVDAAGQVIPYVNAQKPEVRDLLHTVPANEQGLKVRFLLLKFMISSLVL